MNQVSMDAFLTPITAFVATAIAIGLMRPACEKIGLVDHSDDVRKHHATPTPLCGGLGIVAGLSVALFLAAPEISARGWPYLLALLPLLAVGLWDDFVETSSRIRIAAQVISALLMVYVGDVVILQVGDLFETGRVLGLGAWAVPLTVFAVVGVINGVNMIDGLDGLAGGVIFVALGWFATAAFIQGAGVEAGLILALMGAVAGFLAFNMRHPLRSKASVFLGDTGSTALGFAAGWLAIRITQMQADALPPMAAVWIMAVPLLDTLTQIVRRLVEGRNPMSPDRNHMHHMLLRAGLSDAQTVAVILLVSCIFGAIGIGAWQFGVPMHLLFWGSITIYVVYLVVVIRLPKSGKVLNVDADQAH